MRSPFVRLVPLAALLLAALLSGCGVSAQQQVPLAIADLGVIAGDVVVGQTFVAHHDGLAGAQIYLQPDEPGNGVLELRLYAAPGDAAELAGASLPLAAVSGPGFYDFRFDSALPSRQRDYYLTLQLVGAGRVGAGMAPADSYRDGAFYVGGQPIEAQLVHGLIFDRAALLAGYAARLGWLGLALLAGTLIYLVPGLGLLRLLWPGARGLSWGEQLGLGLGLSAALLPLWLVWARLVGLRLGAWNAWALILLGLAAVAWSLRSARPQAWRPSLRALPWLDLGLVGVIALVTAPRLIAAGSLEAPSWGDAYQHTMIAQLILDNGGLFDSWQPYVPYTSLTVQFGFSSLVAGLAWVMGLGSVEATIVAGQLLNAAAIVALYPLALRLSGGRRWAGLATLLVAGLLSPLPGFYVNWGRYAQLSGQLVLPAAIWLSWSLLEAPPRPWRQIGLLGLSVAGLALCYYRMIFFYILFILVLLLCWALPEWRAGWARWRDGIVRLALAGAATGLLFAPWAFHVSQSHLSNVMALGVNNAAPLEYVLADYVAWRDLAQHVPIPLLVIGGVAVLWALARRAWAVAGLGLWIALMSAYSAGSMIQLPGANLMQSFAVIIALYIPLSLLCGWLWAELAELGRHRRASAAAALVFAGLAGWGGLQQLRVIDPAYMLVTRPDIRAMRWIARDTPPDAQFLVHGYLVWNGFSAVGADGGWWIPLLARRGNTMPPQYALSNEEPSPPDYTARLLEFYGQLRETPPPSPEGLRLICEWGITHVYNGQGQGQVGFGADTLFSVDELRASPYFDQVYRQDRVSIFAFDRASCPTVAGQSGAAP
jgi:hypothetical protein